MTELLLYASLKSGIVLALAWLVTALLRRGSADLRHRIWLAALAGAVIVALPLPVPQPVTIVISSGFGISNTGTLSSKNAISWIPWVWFAGMTFVLTRFAMGTIRLARITRSATPSGGAFVSDSVTSPMTWGLIRPVVLLPAYTTDWTEERLDVVLRHERAHIERRDWFWQTLAKLVTAAFWFHPLVWFAVERLRQEAEHATDDMVLMSGSDAAGYADQLLEVARQVRGTAPQALAAVTMVRHSALTSRIGAILDSSRTRTRAGAQARAAVGISAALLVALLSAFQHASAQVYRPGGGVTTPVPIFNVQPGYSEEARRAKIHGTVTVSLTVDAEGHPQDVRVIRGLGYGLDEVAMEAVQKWRFRPGSKDGKPVPVQAIIEVNFKLI